MSPIHDELNESELIKILEKVISHRVKDLIIRTLPADGRRVAIIEAGGHSALLIKKLDGKTLPGKVTVQEKVFDFVTIGFLGFTQKLKVEYAPDRQSAEDSAGEDVAIKRIFEFRPEFSIAGVTDSSSFYAVLMGSPSATIPIRYHAFAQPALDACKEPLVGVDEVHEFCSRDLTYEPAYLCKLCRSRCNCNDLIQHLTSVEHRLKYFVSTVLFHGFGMVLALVVGWVETFYDILGNEASSGLSFAYFWDNAESKVRSPGVSDQTARAGDRIARRTRENFATTDDSSRSGSVRDEEESDRGCW